MKRFGLTVAIGLIGTLFTGGIATVMLQPIIAANIAFGANTWLVAWALAIVGGYIVALIVWVVVVAIAMAVLFTEVEG